MNFRKSYPARMAVNIWTINFFKDDNQNSLIQAIDLQNTDVTTVGVENAPGCVKI